LEKQWLVPLLFYFRIREKLRIDPDVHSPRES
jgi:hypothetical protein